MRGPSLTGLGKRLDLQPSHQALLLMGMSWRTWGSRTNPVVCIAGKVAMVTPLDRSLLFDGSVSWVFRQALLGVGEVSFVDILDCME